MSNPVAAATRAEMAKIDDRIHRIFAMQQANRYRIANTGAKERIIKLKALLNLIHRRKEHIYQALYADFQKPSPEVDITEIYAVATEIKHAIRHLKKWMKPKKVRPTLATLTTSSYIRYEPRGVVLIISPWNFPFNLTFGPLVSAVAAGNCIMVKPSEYSPNTSHLMREMAGELFPENEVAFFEGDKEVSAELLKKPFDHIFFTGSPEVGKIVMKAAAEHLTTVTLELGGKSPVIVDETARIGEAAQKIALGKYLNNGQACIAPDYMFIHQSKFTEFIARFKQQIQAYYGETEEDRRTTPDYARIISDRHHARLVKMIEEAVLQGAKVEIGGKNDPQDRYLAPTVLSGVASDMAVMREEIFGPLFPVIPYQNLDEVLNTINGGPKPLALYVFSRSRKNIRRILSHTSAGGTCINEVMLHFLHVNLPFGGVNNSGFGNSHGFFGFRAFSHERAVLKQSRYTPIQLMLPPFTKTVKKILELTVKYF